MAEFSYKAATTDGKVVEGTMEASDNGTVALQLQEMGLLPDPRGRRREKNPAHSRNPLAMEAEEGAAQGPPGVHP